MADLSLARDWYKLSAEQEYLAAMRAMARSFFQANSPDRNGEMGRRWLELATECGDAEAPYILALSHLLRADALLHETAETWLRLASERGNARATEVLELAASGRSLSEAARFVQSVPFEERYLQRMAEQAGDEPTRPPVLYRMVRPVYPATLRLTDTEGEVVVSFVVSTTGRVIEASAMSSTHPLFGERAVEAVSQWRFHPGRRDGRLVNTRMSVPVYFTRRDEVADGVDGVLGFAQARAAQLGDEVAADAVDLWLAKPVGRLAVPKTSTGESFAPGSRVLLLLVLDDTGRVGRSHILDAKPQDLGPAVKAIAEQARFEPRMINGEAVPSNALLIFGRRR
jgi:TonB family protein